MKGVPGFLVELNELPFCQWCDSRAVYDFRTLVGPWAYGCELHWLANRALPELGVGIGQRLFSPGTKEVTK